MSNADPNNPGSAAPTLLVLAAGMGSRFGSLKQIATLGPCGETLLEYSVHDAIRAGFDRVVFVIRRDFEDQFRRNVASRVEGRIDVDYAYQDLDDLPAPFTRPEGRTKPWGTAHAVLAAREVVRAPFAVINADDFYGADAYARLASFLRTTSPFAAPARFCLVAYELGRTLSENGTVSRGVCKCSPEGRLESITEMEKIRAGSCGPEALRGDQWLPIPADTPVSMNMMGFTPALFPMLEERFRLFLEKRISEPGSECYLPESVSFAISCGQAVVDVIRTTSDWMGITYQADKDAFARRMVDLCNLGLYTSPLWDRFDTCGGLVKKTPC
jgi:hypothetical protein